MVETAAGADDGLPRGETLTFSTTIQPKTFLKLSLRLLLLNVITLTLYRFWAKTQVRERVWQGVRLNDERFEYIGRGTDLFVGFLLALAFLGLPFLILLFAAQFLGPVVAGIVILPAYALFFWLWGFGLFSAFRYMASRTTWRGIRFRLGGSAVSYGLYYLGGVFLTGITLGWFSPAMQRGLAERTWDEVRFGTRRIRFRMNRAEKVGVYGPFALGWCLTAVPYLGFVILMSVLAASGYGMPAFSDLMAGAAPAPVPTPAPAGIDWAVVVLIYLSMLILAPLYMLVWAPYQAALLRSMAYGVTIDSAGFALRVKALPLWWLSVSNIVVIVLTLGALLPWVQARTAKFLVDRLVSVGEARLDMAEQVGKGPRTGEGLADAFGFSVI